MFRCREAAATLTSSTMNLLRRTLLGWAAGLPALAAMPAVARAETFDEALDAAFRVGPPALAGGVLTRDGLIWSGARGGVPRGLR